MEFQNTLSFNAQKTIRYVTITTAATKTASRHPSIRSSRACHLGFLTVSFFIDDYFSNSTPFMASLVLNSSIAARPKADWHQNQLNVFERISPMVFNPSRDSVLCNRTEQDRISIGSESFKILGPVFGILNSICILVLHHIRCMLWFFKPLYFL